MQEWPADTVERWALDRLVPYARNARTHSPAQVAQIAASVREWGWTVADNKLTLNAGWDENLLRVELADLREMGADLELIGFGEDELTALFAEQTSGLTDPDAVPETPVNP